MYLRLPIHTCINTLLLQLQYWCGVMPFTVYGIVTKNDDDNDNNYNSGNILTRTHTHDSLTQAHKHNAVHTLYIFVPA